MKGWEQIWTNGRFYNQQRENSEERTQERTNEEERSRAEFRQKNANNYDGERVKEKEPRENQERSILK